MMRKYMLDIENEEVYTKVKVSNFVTALLQGGILMVCYFLFLDSYIGYEYGHVVMILTALAKLVDANYNSDNFISIKHNCIKETSKGTSLSYIVCGAYTLVLALLGVTNVFWYCLEAPIYYGTRFVRNVFVSKELKHQYPAMTKGSIIKAVKEYPKVFKDTIPFFGSATTYWSVSMLNTMMITMLPNASSDIVFIIKSVGNKFANTTNLPSRVMNYEMITNIKEYKGNLRKCITLYSLPLSVMAVMCVPLMLILSLASGSYSLAVLMFGIVWGLVQGINRLSRDVILANLGLYTQTNKRILACGLVSLAVQYYFRALESTGLVLSMQLLSLIIAVVVAMVAVKMQQKEAYSG